MIVVTGAAGFIGSNLVLELNRRGELDVIAVDVLDSPAKHRNLGRAEFVDLLEPEELWPYLEGAPRVDVVFHQGACADTTVTDGPYMMRTNYRYSVRLAQWCIEHRVPLVYASSAAVYGRGDHGFTERRSAEDPLSLYGFSKFMFDQWVRRHAGSHPVVGLRYFNVYGPHEHHKGRMASVVHKFHAQARRGEALEVFEGSESFVRDFVAVDDVLDVNLWFREHPKPGVYNVGSGQARSFVDLAEIVARHYGARVVRVPFPDDLVGAYQTFTEANLTRLRGAGYERPFTSLEEGVGRYLEVLEGHDGDR